MARTHDISFADCHMKDLATFGKILTEAINAAFPRGYPRYKEVHCLLLSWEQDNLGVISEVLELQNVFQKIYHYDAEEWRIPDTQSYKFLRKRINNFLNDFEDRATLLIVYYGGHALMDDDRQCVWSCTGLQDSVTVQWSGLQNLLENAESDVLILLDCCAAASSLPRSGSGVTEMIAACGFESNAPGVGEHSFTRSLIEELKYWSRIEVLSVASLHAKVVSRIKYWKPRFGDTGEHEHRKTPFHMIIANQGDPRSIKLAPLRPPAYVPVELGTEPVQNAPSESTNSSPKPHSETNESTSNSSVSSLEQMQFLSESINPKVLISLQLSEDQWLHTDEWINWLQSVPALITHANVDGVYESGSTLILLSVPVAVWDLLPSNPAVAFIAFIRTSNMVLGKLDQMIKEQDAEMKRMLSSIDESSVRYDPLPSFVNGRTKRLIPREKGQAKPSHISLATKAPLESTKEEGNLPSKFAKVDEVYQHSSSQLATTTPPRLTTMSKDTGRRKSSKAGVQQRHQKFEKGKRLYKKNNHGGIEYNVTVARADYDTLNQTWMYTLQDGQGLLYAGKTPESQLG